MIFNIYYMDRYTNYIDYLGFHYRLIFNYNVRKDGKHHIRFVLEIKLSNRHNYWEKINLLTHFRDMWNDYFKTQDIVLTKLGNGQYIITSEPINLIETLVKLGFEKYSKTRYIYTGQEMLMLNTLFTEILKSDVSSLQKINNVEDILNYSN
jgi:hypothetical protein